MALPDMSSLMYVAHLRHIQSIHEPAELRNPDILVRNFLPITQRWRAAWIGRHELATLRRDPFYYYLVARTRYYDQLVADAVADGVRKIVSVGCGSDTRPYRFADLLRSKGVTVLECDQPEAIESKRRIARRWRPHHVEYLPIDLNDETWPELQDLLRDGKGTKFLVMMEGVSPYVNDDSFRRFLQLAGTSLTAGSHLAYDFKIGGVDDDFGRVGRTERPFRLPGDKGAVTAFHEEQGLHLIGFELSSDLCARLLPGLTTPSAPFFGEDGLVRLRARGL